MLSIIWAALASAQVSNFRVEGVVSMWADSPRGFQPGTDFWAHGMPCMFAATPCTQKAYSGGLPDDTLAAFAGETVHIAYWLINEDDAAARSVTFSAGALTSGSDAIPASAVEIRYLTYVDTQE